MKMPEIVKEYILNKCKNGQGRVILRDPTSWQLLSQLEFDEEGMSKTINDQVSITGYIERILTFSKKDVMIFIDEESLDQIPKLLNTTDSRELLSTVDGLAHNQTDGVQFPDSLP